MNNTAENNSKNSNDINENSKSLRKLSVVVSVYNEEKALREFYKETNKILEQIRKSGWEHELIFVNCLLYTSCPYTASSLQRSKYHASGRAVAVSPSGI